MPYNYLLKIDQSYGGRSNVYKWSTGFNIESEAEMGDPVLDSIIGSCVEILRVGSFNVVHFMRANLSELMQTPTQQGQKTFMSRELQLKGYRVPTSPLVPDNMCLVVKRDAITGRSGTMFLRGMLEYDDLISTEDHTFDLVDRAQFTTGGVGSDTLIEKLNAGFFGGRFIFPNKPLNFLDQNRGIRAHRLAGVGFKQPMNKRRSAEAELADGAEREINELQKSIVRLLKGTVFTAINPLYQTKILNNAKRIKEIFEALEPDRAMKIALDDVLKALPGGPEI
jgi:hypothetical protein